METGRGPTRSIDAREHEVSTTDRTTVTQVARSAASALPQGRA